MSEFCKDCFTGSILPGEPRGEIVKIGNISAYVATPRNSEFRNDVAVIYGTDAFGLGIVNNKILPDQLADALGCIVYVPDLLEGDYPPSDGLHMIDQPISHRSYFYQATQYLQAIWSFLTVFGPRWMARHPRGKMQPLSEGLPYQRFAISIAVSLKVYKTEFAKVLRKEKQLKKVGMVGYCMGGIMTCALSGTGLIDVAVVAHPGPLGQADFEKVRVPISFICSEEDFTFTASVKKLAEGIIGKKTDVPSEFRTYEGTTHGFAVRPNLSIPIIKESFHSAFDQAVSWFKTYLFI